MDIARARTEAAAAYRKRLATMDAQNSNIHSSSHAFGQDRRRRARRPHPRRPYGDMAHRTRAVRRVPSPSAAVDAAAQRSIALSVAAVLSDFEWACRDLLTDALEFWEKSWTPVLGEAKPPGPASSPLAKRGWAGRSPTHYERSLREAASCRIATRCSTLRRQRRILLRCPCSISFADAGTELSIQIPRLGATWWNSENQERSRRLSNLTDLRFVE
jgi:hypothetical protein